MKVILDAARRHLGFDMCAPPRATWNVVPPENVVRCEILVVLDRLDEAARAVQGLSSVVCIIGTPGARREPRTG